MSQGYQHQVAALDSFLEHCLEERNIQDLSRLNTYIRRYLSPVVTRQLFMQKQLPLLLQKRKIETLTALILDMRGFVRTTKSGEQTKEGLEEVARLLRHFFTWVIRIAFEYQGLVGEFAGDRVLITFGFPPPSDLTPSLSPSKEEDLALNVQRAVGAAFALQHMTEHIIRTDESFHHSLRQFEVGIGICAGGPAWIGDIGDNHAEQFGVSWRQELTVISTAVNIAARAEELTKDLAFISDAPEKKIIVNHTVIDQIRQQLPEQAYRIRAKGPVEVRGLDERVDLFHFIHLSPDAFPQPEPILPEDRQLVSWICEHIEGAIERNIITKVHRSLTDVQQLIVSRKSPDEHGVFRQIMRKIVDSMKVEKATLYQLDPFNDTLEVMSSEGPNPLPIGLELPMGEGTVAGLVASSGEIAVIPDVHHDPRWHGKQDDPIHSMICVPLKTDDCVIGVIQVMDDKPGVFKQTDLSALDMFAGLATVALENARTYDRERRIGKAHLTITQAFSNATTLDAVLDAVMEAIKETLTARNATLYLLDNDTGELVFEKILSERQPVGIFQGKRLPSGTGIVGWVVENKCPIIVYDTYEIEDELAEQGLAQWRAEHEKKHIASIRGVPRTSSPPRWYSKADPNIRSIICVPLIAKGQTVGAIQVVERPANFFTQEHLDILEWLSASAAVAVDNAAQLEQTRRKLIAADTIAGMGAIAGKLAHNLKNYVSGIKTIAKYQLKTDDEKSRQKIDKIIVAADQALAEVKNFMQPLKDGTAAATLNFAEALSEVIEEVRETLKGRQQVIESKPTIQIDLSLSEDSILVTAVRDDVKYIFRNLLDNAIRAIDLKDEPEGRISISTTVETINEIRWGRVTVQDTGGGIHPSHIEKIFKRNFTTRPEGTPGGYGLFWVQLNVERMGGKITVDSELGVGTRFEVRLPLSREG